MSIEHFPKFVDGEPIDFDKGDLFTAQYTPVGYEDLPPFNVAVKVLDFNDDEAAYGWEIIAGPKEVTGNEEIKFGFGFDEFQMIGDYTQNGAKF